MPYTLQLTLKNEQCEKNNFLFLGHTLTVNPKNLDFHAVNLTAKKDYQLEMIF